MLQAVAHERRQRTCRSCFRDVRCADYRRARRYGVVAGTGRHPSMRSIFPLHRRAVLEFLERANVDRSAALPWSYPRQLPVLRKHLGLCRRANLSSPAPPICSSKSPSPRPACWRRSSCPMLQPRLCDRFCRLANVDAAARVPPAASKWASRRTHEESAVAAARAAYHRRVQQPPPTWKPGSATGFPRSARARTPSPCCTIASATRSLPSSNPSGREPRCWWTPTRRCARCHRRGTGWSGHGRGAAGLR